jgi:hypothetical protein
LKKPFIRDIKMKHSVVAAGEGQRPRAVREPAEWLGYEGRWGSTVEAPAKQEWFACAENPVSRTWLQQVFNLHWLAARNK